MKQFFNGYLNIDTDYKDNILQLTSLTIQKCENHVLFVLEKWT